MIGRPKRSRAGASKRSRSKSQQAKSKARPQMPDTSSDGSINGIRAMLVGLSVLQAVARERRPLPLREVAAASGLTPSRVHRYLSSLVAANFIEQDAASGEYSLGQSVVELGLLALGQLDAIRIGIDALVEFNEHTEFDGHLSVWGTFGPTVVRWQSGRLGYHFRIDEGRVLPLLWSATGRVLMAYRDFKDIESLVKQEITAWNRDHPDRPIDRRDVIEMCAAVRRHGLSSSIPSHKIDKLVGPIFPRMYRLGLETAAVPILDHLGRAPMALTFFGADDGPSINEDTALQKELRRVAETASRRLGGGQVIPVR